MPKGLSLCLYQHIDREIEFIQPLIALVVLAVDFVRVICFGCFSAHFPAGFMQLSSSSFDELAYIYTVADLEY